MFNSYFFFVFFFGSYSTKKKIPWMLFRTAEKKNRIPKWMCDFCTQFSSCKYLYYSEYKKIRIMDWYVEFFFVKKKHTKNARHRKYGVVSGRGYFWPFTIRLNVHFKYISYLHSTFVTVLWLPVLLFAVYVHWKKNCWNERTSRHDACI